MLRTAELSADQLADLHDVDAGTVRRWTTDRHDPPCPHRKDGRGRLRFDAAAVDEWLASSGVLRRSLAQRPAPGPGPMVSILDAVQWHPSDVADPDLDDDDREMVAAHRTVVTCLHVCRHREELPTPDDFDLDTEAGRGDALDWLASLPHLPAGDWRYHADKAVHRDDYPEAIYGH